MEVTSKTINHIACFLKTFLIREAVLIVIAAYLHSLKHHLNFFHVRDSAKFYSLLAHSSGYWLHFHVFENKFFLKTSL